MPQMSSNIPSAVFYGSVLSEFLRIARCTLLSEDFIPKANQLFQRMVTQGGKKSLIFKQIEKACLRHPTAFLKFNKSPQDIAIAATDGLLLYFCISFIFLYVIGFLHSKESLISLLLRLFIFYCVLPGMIPGTSKTLCIHSPIAFLRCTFMF